jgi:hypothetical protein
VRERERERDLTRDDDNKFTTASLYGLDAPSGGVLTLRRQCVIASQCYLFQHSLDQWCLFEATFSHLTRKVASQAVADALLQVIGE